MDEMRIPDNDLQGWLEDFRVIISLEDLVWNDNRKHLFGENDLYIEKKVDPEDVVRHLVDIGDLIPRQEMLERNVQRLMKKVERQRKARQKKWEEVFEPKGTRWER